jgi:hypothetical protein
VRRASAWLVLLLIACPPPARAEDAAQQLPGSSCTSRDVNRGLLSDESSWPEHCPRPAASALLGDEAANALMLQPSNAQAQAQLMAALHTLARTAQGERPWGPAFAERIERLLEGLDPSQCEQPWELAFSDLHAPIDPISACQCAFEVGSDGDPGHACFRFPQAGGAALPVCNHPRLQLYDLPDWPALARAYVSYDLARRALLALSGKCRELVVTRLAGAEARWHRLVTRGYVQYPWELWFSRAISDDYGNFSRCFASDPSCSGDAGLDPETLRPIFLHPGVGLGLAGFGEHDGKVSAQARLVIMVEALGLNVYDRDFKEFLGASLGVGFQDANFARPRLGAFVHLSRYLQVGYLLGIVSETRAQGTLYLSMDVLGWANRALGLTEPKFEAD